MPARPTMSRRHFELIARAIKLYRQSDSIDLAQSIADVLEDTNEQFNRQRFIDACGPKTTLFDSEKRRTRTHSEPHTIGDTFANDINDPINRFGR